MTTTAAIVADVAAFAEEEGGDALLMAKMGQDGRRGAKVVAPPRGHRVRRRLRAAVRDPEEVARAAVENDVHVVGVSSQAAGHKTLVPQLISELRRSGGDDILVVCGA